MPVIVWIVEGTWPACVDAARTHTPEDTDIVLLHVTSHDIPGGAHGAYAGLLGRAHPEHDPGTRLEHLAAGSAERLLNAAADRLQRPCTRLERIGRCRTGSRRRSPRRRPTHPRPRRGPHPPRTEKPQRGHPLRRRPRTLPHPPGLARTTPNHRHPTTTSTAPSINPNHPNKPRRNRAVLAARGVVGQTLAERCVFAGVGDPSHG